MSKEKDRSGGKMTQEKKNEIKKELNRIAERMEKIARKDSSDD